MELTDKRFWSGREDGLLSSFQVRTERQPVILCIMGGNNMFVPVRNMFNHSFYQWRRFNLVYHFFCIDFSVCGIRYLQWHVFIRELVQTKICYRKNKEAIAGRILCAEH